MLSPNSGRDQWIQISSPRLGTISQTHWSPKGTTNYCRLEPGGKKKSVHISDAQNTGLLDQCRLLYKGL